MTLAHRDVYLHPEAEVDISITLKLRFKVARGGRAWRCVLAFGAG